MRLTFLDALFIIKSINKKTHLWIFNKNKNGVNAIMNVNHKYWKVVCRYGHVGRKNEISVSRYLHTIIKDCTLMDVIKIVSEMPGVKKGSTVFHSIVKAIPITKEQYEEGKIEEKQNLYLKKLMSFKPSTTKKIA